MQPNDVKSTAMSAFILAGRTKLLPEPSPSSSEHYDPALQLWIDSASGRPLVETLRNLPGSSRYGETLMTETREGVDQSEGSIQASSYGETTITKTSEGADQMEAIGFDARGSESRLIPPHAKGQIRSKEPLAPHPTAKRRVRAQEKGQTKQK